MTRFPRIRALFSGYLHADWDLEADSLTGVAELFAREGGPVVAAELRTELDDLTAAGGTEQSIRQLLADDFGYDPIWRDRSAVTVIAEFRAGLPGRRPDGDIE